MIRLFVVDTNALIAFFSNVFSTNLVLSSKVNRLINSAIYDQYSNIRISVPNIVFLEIFDLYSDCEEKVKQIFYEVFVPIRDSNNMEIRSLDKEVIKSVMKLDSNLLSHDINDKIIISVAIILDCPLISSDEKLHTYHNLNQSSPKIIF